MVDQVAMDTPIAIIKRMNVDEAKREDGRRNNGIKFL